MGWQVKDPLVFALGFKALLPQVPSQIFYFFAVVVLPISYLSAGLSCNTHRTPLTLGSAGTRLPLKLPVAYNGCIQLRRVSQSVTFFFLSSFSFFSLLYNVIRSCCAEVSGLFGCFVSEMAAQW